MGRDAWRIALVGPVPPPAGGMATQTHQLCVLLRREGIAVTLISTNAPYRPRWIGRIRIVRALFRLFAYIGRLWRETAGVGLVHVMANSGWSWHLFAAPAVWIARLRGVPAIVNYRGGEAEAFLSRSHRLVGLTLKSASTLVVPSGFLQQIFARHGIASEIVPNIVDVERFRAASQRARSDAPNIVVARHLERIYDIPTALGAFAHVRREVTDARLTIAGSGPARVELVGKARELGIEAAVDFVGSLDRDAMAALYRSASIALNPSRVDNMPNSVLEAMASGVPVVSTNVGGVPYIVRDNVTGVLVPPGDCNAMASAILRVLRDAALADRLRANALREVEQFAWPNVRDRWMSVYRNAGASSGAAERPA